MTEDIQLAEEAARKLCNLLNDLGLSLPPSRAEVTPTPPPLHGQMPPTEQSVGMSRALRRGLAEVNILVDVLRQQLLG